VTDDVGCPRKVSGHDDFSLTHIETARRVIELAEIENLVPFEENPRVVTKCVTNCDLLEGERRHDAELIAPFPDDRYPSKRVRPFV